MEVLDKDFESGPHNNLQTKALQWDAGGKGGGNAKFKKKKKKNILLFTN
jgi:hypothetical protein